MKIPSNVQPEIQVIGKVLDFIDHTFPGELKKASQEYEKTTEAKTAKGTSEFYNGFLSYFLLQRKINGGTPMEHAFLFPFDYFSRQDKQIINNFVDHIESLFEIVDVKGKDYTIRNTVNGRKYLVNTIDFPVLIKKEQLVRALIVKRNEGSYFFYGNVWTYAPEDEKEMREYVQRFVKSKKKAGARKKL